ncbi:MAG: Single-stranded DNA binding protein [Methanomethylovorans sp.]|uniref:Single-stranded DNA binding protein n=1 Tax=Methanomethylovorans sp. TaxID=2758717 RepID=UPI003531471D
MSEKYAPHIEELAKALNGIDQDDIKNEFNKLLKFRVPLDEAKRTILNKFSSKEGPEIKIKDIFQAPKSFTLNGRVLAVEKKSFVLKGETLNLYSGKVADETGVCFFTAWSDFSLKEGDIIRVHNAYMKHWNNRPELNFGQRSVVEKLPEDPSMPRDEQLFTQSKKIIEINSSDMLVSSKGIVTEMYHRDVSIKGTDTKIIEGVVADETGKLPFTSWLPMKGVDIGSFISFKAAQVRLFRGIPSLNFTNETSWEILPKDQSPFSKKDLISDESTSVPISSVLEKDGIFDVVVTGNIISVRPGSGIIERCPVCNRVIQNNICRAHGNVTGIKDMRIKAILDDGTGAVYIMLNKELSEIVFGESMEEAENIMKDSLSKDAVYESMKRSLIGSYLTVRGNSSKNEFGTTIVARSAWLPEDALLSRLECLLQKLPEDS